MFSILSHPCSFMVYYNFCCVLGYYYFQVSLCRHNYLKMIKNGNWTERSPIWSVIIRVITKSDDRAAGVRFVYHEYDYRLNWTARSLITN